MKVLLKIIAGILALAALGVGAVFVFPTPEAPEAMLRAKYGQAPSQFLKLPGGTVAHFRDYPPVNGDAAAPVLVMLHGSNASLHTWEPWVQRLRPAMRVVTVDLPGHGLTGATVEGDYSPDGMAAFVETFTRTLGIEHPFVLIGSSMGGHVAWRYTITHPERVAKLVLLDASGVQLPGPEPPVPLAFRLARNPLTAPLVRRMAPRRMFAATVPKAFYNKSLATPEMVDRYWELNRRHGTPAATIARFALPRIDEAMVARLGEIKAPTLVLWGREDELQPLGLADFYARAIPNARVIKYDNCGHLPMEEAPDRSAADVRAFVEGPAKNP